MRRRRRKRKINKSDLKYGKMPRKRWSVSLDNELDFKKMKD